MSDYLPEDVLPDILARLAAEDLVRCTTVCKKWYVLIRSPSFISLQLKQSLQDKDRNYLLIRTPTAAVDCYYLCSEDTFHEHKRFTIQPNSMFEQYFRIVSSCNGLICLLDGRVSNNKKIFIWNPVIRKAIYVPSPNVQLDQFSSYAVGFGFDSFTSDHKFVKITYPPLHFSDKPLVQVYSINKGAWKKVRSDRVPTHIVLNEFQQAYVRGAAHWLAESTGNCHILILVFDMKDERFHEMPVPESLPFHQSHNHELRLHVRQESISLFHHYSFYNAGSLDIWVMREYGVPKSWARQLKVDLNAAGLGRNVVGTAIAMRSSGEIVFASRKGELLSYDCERNLFSDRKKIGHFSVAKVYMGAYTESLLLLDKGEYFYDMPSRRRVLKIPGGSEGTRLIVSDPGSNLDGFIFSES